MKYTYTEGPNNVNYLTAPYALLVAAFGSGTSAPRDDYKSMAQWDVGTLNGEVEIYDYKIGKCYDPEHGLERHAITDWHVQGDAAAIRSMLVQLDRHVSS